MFTNEYYGDFVALDGFTATLTDTLYSDDVYLNLSERDEQRLIELLDSGYSYLVIHDGNVKEPILVTTYCGKLRIIRSAPRKFSYRCGVCIKFVVTQPVIEALVCQDFDCEEKMPYIELPSFVSNLTETLDAVDTDLPIHAQHIAYLSQALPSGSFTNFIIQDGYRVELVKLVSQDGKLYIERGLGTTTPATFPKGSAVTWLMTTDGVKAIVCQMECCPDKSDDTTITTLNKGVW